MTLVSSSEQTEENDDDETPAGSEYYYKTRNWFGHCCKDSNDEKMTFDDGSFTLANQADDSECMAACDARSCCKYVSYSESFKDCNLCSECSVLKTSSNGARYVTVEKVSLKPRETTTTTTTIYDAKLALCGITIYCNVQNECKDTACNDDGNVEKRCCPGGPDAGETRLSFVEGFPWQATGACSNFIRASPSQECTYEVATRSAGSGTTRKYTGDAWNLGIDIGYDKIRTVRILMKTPSTTDATTTTTTTTTTTDVTTTPTTTTTTTTAVATTTTTTTTTTTATTKPVVMAGNYALMTNGRCVEPYKFIEDWAECSVRNLPFAVNLRMLLFFVGLLAMPQSLRNSAAILLMPVCATKRVYVCRSSAAGCGCSLILLTCAILMMSRMLF